MMLCVVPLVSNAQSTAIPDPNSEQEIADDEVDGDGLESGDLTQWPESYPE